MHSLRRALGRRIPGDIIMRNLNTGTTGRFQRVELEKLVEKTRPFRLHRWAASGILVGAIIVAALRALA